MHIKIATQSSDVDLDDLAALLVELDKIHHHAAPDRFPLFPFEERKKDLAKIFDQGCIVYAEHNAKIIGFASLMRKKDALMIEHLFVLPGFRLQKIGTQIVKKNI